MTNQPKPSDFENAQYDWEGKCEFEFVGDFGQIMSEELTRVIKHKETGELWSCEVYTGGSWGNTQPWKEGCMQRVEAKEITKTEYVGVGEVIDYGDNDWDDEEEED